MSVISVMSKEQLQALNDMVEHQNNIVHYCLSDIDALRAKIETILQNMVIYNATQKLTADHLVSIEKRLNQMMEKDSTKSEIIKKNIFEFKRVSAKAHDDIRHIRNVLYDFYCWIIDNVPNNSERENGITKLEECAMWLNKSISRSE